MIQPTDALKMATAYHEAGHVVMAKSFGVCALRATVNAEPNEASGKIILEGHAQFEPKELCPAWTKESPPFVDDLRGYLEMRALITLAGLVSHRLLDPKHQDDAGDQYDRKQAREHLCRFALSENHLNAWISALEVEASERLRRELHLLNAVVRAFVEHETLDRERLCEAMKAACPPTKEKDRLRSIPQRRIRRDRRKRA